jgi:transposase InsO family protein
LVLEPFDKWALDFVGLVNPASHHNSYILVSKDYVKTWMDATALPFMIEKDTVVFLHEEIFTRFGILQEIVIDRGTQFTSRFIKYLMDRNKIKHRVTIQYHPQDNRKVEWTNKILEVIITNNVILHLMDWADKLSEAL